MSFLYILVSLMMSKWIIIWKIEVAWFQSVASRDSFVRFERNIKIQKPVLYSNFKVRKDPWRILLFWLKKKLSKEIILLKCLCVIDTSKKYFDLVDAAFEFTCVILRKFNYHANMWTILYYQKLKGCILWIDNTLEESFSVSRFCFMARIV